VARRIKSKDDVWMTEITGKERIVVRVEEAVDVYLTEWDKTTRAENFISCYVGFRTRYVICKKIP
jgi:hypothetical protein